MNRLSMITTAVSSRELIFRFIGIVLGAVLMTAGVVKGLGIHSFINQINQYGLLPDDTRITGSLAWFMVIVEIAFGAALIVNWRATTVLSGVMAMLLIFIGALAWAIIKGGVDDCGCFGQAAVRSPTQALFEDVILLIGTIAAWHLSRGRIQYPHPVKGWVVAIACVFGLALPVTTGSLPWSRTIQALASPGSPQEIVLRAPTGEVIDFKTGTALLAVMSTDCFHCRESVPRLNDIVEEIGQTIQVYGVAANQQREIDRFVEENFTFYPIIPIDEKSLTTLLGADPLPKFVFIHDGNIVAQWSDHLPSSQALIDLATEVKGA